MFLPFCYAIAIVESLLANLIHKMLTMFAIAVAYFFIWPCKEIHFHIKLLKGPKQSIIAQFIFKK